MCARTLALGFREEGWTVLEAGAGVGALKWIQEIKIIDLLITDIALADATTGWDVAEAFRERRPSTPVIYASGNPDNQNRRVSNSVFLGKPVTARELISACRGLHPIAG